jgi:ABC-type transport system involved in cytochrome bd biosynthesis fused ATPase/permease subunit
MGMAKERAVHRPLFEIIPALGTVAVLALGGIRVVDGAMSIGEFVSFTQYLAVMVLPLMITGWFFANLPRSAAAAARIDLLLATAPEIADPRHPVQLSPGRGEVRFNNVHFEYPDGTKVLEGVDLVIPGGTSVGLVGATGAGKTTMAHLIPYSRNRSSSQLRSRTTFGSVISSRRTRTCRPQRGLQKPMTSFANFPMDMTRSSASGDRRCREVNGNVSASHAGWCATRES